MRAYSAQLTTHPGVGVVVPTGTVLESSVVFCHPLFHRYGTDWSYRPLWLPFDTVVRRIESPPSRWKSKRPVIPYDRVRVDIEIVGDTETDHAVA
jgi:hypothetical protein